MWHLDHSLVRSHHHVNHHQSVSSLAGPSLTPHFMSQEAGVICVVTRPTTTSKDLEAFRQEVQEAHKARREFLGIENISVLSHEHYVALEETSQACLDLYEVDTVGPLLEGLSLLEQGGQGPLVTASYIYKIQRHVGSCCYPRFFESDCVNKPLMTHSTHGLTPGHSSETPGLLVQVSMEPPMTHLDGFNKWCVAFVIEQSIAR